jgi:hypothetical protein
MLSSLLLLLLFLLLLLRFLVLLLLRVFLFLRRLPIYLRPAHIFHHQKHHPVLLLPLSFPLLFILSLINISEPTRRRGI